jgi:hypothetical protein
VEKSPGLIGLGTGGWLTGEGLNAGLPVPGPALEKNIRPELPGRIHGNLSY